MQLHAGIRDQRCTPEQLAVLDTMAHKLHRGEVIWQEAAIADSLAALPQMQGLADTVIRDILRLLQLPADPGSADTHVQAAGLMADRFLAALSDELSRFSREYEVPVQRMQQNLRNYLQYELHGLYASGDSTALLTPNYVSAVPVSGIEKLLFTHQDINGFYDRFYFILRNSRYSFRFFGK